MNKLAEKLKELFARPRHKEVVPIVYDSIDWADYIVESVEDSEYFFGQIKSRYDEWAKDGMVFDLIPFFNNDKSHGFAIQGALLEQEDCNSLDLIRILVDRLERLEYEIQISEVATHQVHDGIETVYKVYLKPALHLRVNLPAHQLYGNIEITYKLQDDTPHSLRLLAHTYSDRSYLPAYSQKEFIDQVIGLG